MTQIAVTPPSSELEAFFSQHIKQFKRNRKPEATGICPFHDDHNPSLNINVEKGVYHCPVCKASGNHVTFAEDRNIPLDQVPGWNPQNRSGKTITEGVFVYRAEDGKPFYRVNRQRRPDGSKTFPVERFEGKKWLWGLGETRRVLYNLPELVKWPHALVFIVEGEKKCEKFQEAINKQSPQGAYVVTTNPHGAGKWREEYNKSLVDRNIAILPDNDTPGHNHAQEVARSLHNTSLARSIRVVDLPGLPPKGDIEDWLDAGHSAQEVLDLFGSTEIWNETLQQETGGGDTPRDPLISLSSLISLPHEPKWPAELAPEAFYGLAGEIVRTIEPHSEADPAALLTNLLVSFGNVIGNEPHFVVGADRHSQRLFAVLVGISAKARKGLSWGPILNLMSHGDPEWKENHITSGLSSGEGLIWGVRDPMYHQVPTKDKGRIVDYETVESDPGVSDKRLFIIESEFARTLKSMGREGNVLSSVMRQAWDSGNLNTLTKSPVKATGSHISIIGHITKEELLRYLDSTEMGNGFANRFLWVVVKRSKMLPFGGKLPQSSILEMGEKLKKAIEFARSVSEVNLDRESMEIWEKVYGKLTEEMPGLVGAITNRAEAQVRRLASIYALLDCSDFVKAEHLMAALAVWERAEKSVRYIFGDKLGDPVADTILMGLRSNGGLNATEISKLFSRHVSADRITRALSTLFMAKLAKPARNETRGRPETFWEPF